MKIVLIVGARPQFVKLAPLISELKEDFECFIIHTGQHFDKEMSSAFFSDLNIPLPDINLNINTGLHGEQTGRMLQEIEKALISIMVDLVIVFGDTNSTLAGALAAAKLNLPVIHVEAGLRSFNRKMPEEINRIVADHTADILFAPTETAMNNLRKENLVDKSFNTGDIMVDSLELALENAVKVRGKDEADSEMINGGYYLLTLHRPYNVDDVCSLERILKELGLLKKLIVFPVHPRTRKIIDQNNIDIPDNMKLLNPKGYLEFVRLQKNAYKIITDSGGVQKEAYILKKPCITLRSETEWIETVEAGWNYLLDPKRNSNYSMAIENFSTPEEHKPLFGNKVSSKMKNIIKIKYG